MIDDLLDVTRNPRKPQYNMASEVRPSYVWSFGAHTTLQVLCVLCPGSMLVWSCMPHLTERRGLQDPLVLYRCSFDALQFRRCSKSLHAAQSILEKRLQGQLVRATMLASALARIQQHLLPGTPGSKTPGDWPRHHPLMEREREMSVEERIKKLAERHATNTGSCSSVPCESCGAEPSCPVVRLPHCSPENQRDIPRTAGENRGCSVEVGAFLLRVPILPRDVLADPQEIETHLLDMQPALR